MSTPVPAVDRKAAARRSVEARQVRAAVKRRIASGELSPVRAVREAAGSPYARMRVTEFLAAIPGVGPVRASTIMREIGISAAKRMGGLGVRQREALARRLAFGVSKSDREENRLFVLAGPTAVGKGTVATFIHNHEPGVMLSVSATTRRPRVNEVEGVSYYFVSDAEFDRMVRDGEFLEWATVHNAYRYGTPRRPVETALASGKKVLLEIDLQGARRVRETMPRAFLVFLMPPSWEELVRRLIGRGTEGPEERRRRLETAKVELAAASEFDAIVINDDVERAAREIAELMGFTR